VARIVFTSGAYLGDVAPFVEPANRLAASGHEVTFLLPAGFHPLLQDEQFALARHPLDFSPSGMAADPVHEQLLRHPVANQVRLARYWMRRGFADDPDLARQALLRALDGADLLVTHPTSGAASVPVAQHLGVPVVVGQLFPMMMPTSSWAPPTGRRNLDLRRPANRLAWVALAWGSGAAMYDRTFNRHRDVLGLGPLRGSSLLAWTGAERTVVLVSRHYFGPEPDDWPGWQLGGFSPWSGPRDRRTDPRVEEHLEAGEPPVLVCLGTSAAAGAAATFATIADGLARASLRALLLVGSASNAGLMGRTPGTFEFAPVVEVADRCCAAVVSGALGTLAAALRAGLPVVVLPQLFDQLWHGRRVEELGVGILVTRPEDVAGAVASVLGDPSYRERARQLAGALRAEDGAGALVAAVEATI
jgi:sterol 3beta-glucosyltransferase